MTDTATENPGLATFSTAKPRFICVCTPTLGQVPIQWATALHNILQSWPHNIGMTSCFMTDKAGGEIAETRNAIVANCLAQRDIEITHLLWLDDDVLADAWSCRQLYLHDTDIASGVYFTREAVSEPLIYPEPGRGADRFVPGRTYPVWGHGMGLTLVKTEVYREIDRRLNLPRDKYDRPQWYRTIRPDEALRVGNFGGCSEDLWFCNLAREAGYQPLIDTSQHAFGFHYDAKTRQGYPQKQWAQASSGQPITWDTPDGPVEWR